MSRADDKSRSSRQFPTTSWSLVLGAQQASQASIEGYARHMTRLAEVYWPPVYSFIRHVWRKDHDQAKDLTQEFFATVIFEQKLVDGFVPQLGGFRPFLRAAITKFMAQVQRTSATKKRGGGLTIASLDALGAVRFDSLTQEKNLTPEQMFDVAWNEAVIKEALQLLRQQLTAAGRGVEFEVFKRYDYEGDSARVSYAELANDLNLTPAQVRHALSDVRKMFREMVTDIVSGYTDNPAQLGAELRALFGL